MISRVLAALVLCVAFGQAQPNRIVSTAPDITEILFALGLGSRVVGVSRYCTYPPEATKLPKVGSFIKPEPELIARLTPDLVILHKMPNDVSGRLTGLGIANAFVKTGSL